MTINPFAEYKAVLENVGAKLNPPASLHQILDAKSEGMPEFICDLYSLFDGMLGETVDPRNELHICSVSDCREYKLDALSNWNLNNIDNLYIIGHVLIYGFYIAVGRDRHDGVFYLGSSVDRAFCEFDDFLEKILEGNYWRNTVADLWITVTVRITVTVNQLRCFSI